MNKKVLVFTEIREGTIRNVSLEAIATARQIAGDQPVISVVFDDGSSISQDVLAHHGADRIYRVTSEKLHPYTPFAHTQAYVEIIEEVQPDVILLGHTGNGKDVAPRVAARLNIGLISDCVDVEITEDGLVWTRPIYAGKAYQKKKIDEGIVFATLRPNNFPLQEPDTGRTAEVIPIDVQIQDLRSVVKEVVKKTSSGVDLSEARVIVSGGRGVKSAEGFAPLKELADVLGGVVGASRGACDAGYCDYSLQIGQTGKVVTPDLYIACGISGAIQHLAGMSSSKVIVAINKDPEAPIFEIADYGIVGDLFEVVPRLTEEFKSILVEK